MKKHWWAIGLFFLLIIIFLKNNDPKVDSSPKPIFSVKKNINLNKHLKESLNLLNTASGNQNKSPLDLAEISPEEFVDKPSLKFCTVESILDCSLCGTPHHPRDCTRENDYVYYQSILEFYNKYYDNFKNHEDVEQGIEIFFDMFSNTKPYSEKSFDELTIDNQRLFALAQEEIAKVITDMGQGSYSVGEEEFFAPIMNHYSSWPVQCLTQEDKCEKSDHSTYSP